MKKNTFIVKVDNHQHSTWQGEIIWAEENKRKHFRSSLELLMLMNEAMKNSEESSIKKAN